MESYSNDHPGINIVLAAVTQHNVDTTKILVDHIDERFFEMHETVCNEAAELANSNKLLKKVCIGHICITVGILIGLYFAHHPGIS